ncbi:Ribosomal protein L18e/L15 [Carpediemonas membranifera]|uniref:Ribosomal protein L18e/L15 n=1 Tax=Carpediemonas membranifera TaxID=201153 RepID=A0A8J6B4C9_9EUKA|nr:Ribosomal protein L18e/L15 [Carpediemonas membranifera]|eukprot:KAG9395448.1 Ribosomal protein L18e/L15 [Carpediemonas membranifera]
MDVIAKTYEQLARRTESAFAKRVYHRLQLTRVNRHPLSIASIARFVKENEIAVVVAPVTNDERMIVVPKMRVAALRFTETARARIEKAGGECLTLDQLAVQCPTGKQCVLVRGKMHSREARKHFGIPGAKRSHVKPYVAGHGKNRKKEMSHGQH